MPRYKVLIRETLDREYSVEIEQPTAEEALDEIAELEDRALWELLSASPESERREDWDLIDVEPEEVTK